jgi:FkbM family methyltransferase
MIHFIFTKIIIFRLEDFIEKIYKLFLILTGRNRVNKYYNTAHEVKILYKYFNKKINFVLDIGSFRGDYVDCVLKYNNTAKIICIEPNIVNYNFLKGKYSTLKNVEIYNIGFSNKIQTRFLYSDKKNSGLSSVFKNLNLKFKKKVNFVSYEFFIKNYFKKNKLNKNTLVDLVKIDAEGFDYFILKGMGSYLKKTRLIQFEQGFKSIISKVFFIQFYNFLTENNFSIYRIGLNGPIKINKYNYNLEVFMSQNFIAVNRFNNRN